ncbi:MAG: uroporphyrinogen-III synthase [Trueperaceae bacterium]
MSVTKPLTGKRIAVAGGRKFDELASIIAKQGGEALCRPMMGSVSNDSTELSEVVRKVCERGADWFVLVTGVGTKALLEKADELNLGERLRELLSTAKIAARGYKTFNALKTLGLKPVIVDDDGTVEGVRRQLEEGQQDFLNSRKAYAETYQKELAERIQQEPVTYGSYPPDKSYMDSPWYFKGKRVTVQLHGERMPALTDWLLSQGATVTEIPLYFYEEPSEETVQQLLYEVLSNEVDVVAFTSNTQVKFFFECSRKLNAESFLQKAFNEKVIALSVGSMTTAELKKNGITRIIAPEHERMGAMIMELVAYYQQGSQSSLPMILTKLSRVLVIGGGKVAERKVKALLDANIKPTVISPELTQGLLELKTQQKITHVEKHYETTDIQNAQLIIAATRHENVNQHIANDAFIHNVLCNVVDNPNLGNVHTVGTIRRGDLLVTVSSNGKSPSLTRYVREELEQHFSDRYVEVLELLHTHREEVAKLDEGSRHKLISDLLNNPESTHIFNKGFEVENPVELGVTK